MESVSPEETLVRQISTISFCVHQDLSLHNPSDTLSHYLPNAEGGTLTDLFEVVRPAGAIDFSSLRDTYGAMVLLVTRDQTFAVRGQFIDSTNGNALIFVGSPWLSWITQNAPQTQIRMKDFASTDVQLDQLIFLSTEQQNLKDLHQLTEELRQAKDAAEQANEIQSKFFALMSHEMRTPLNGVSAALDLIDDHQLEGESLKMLQIARNSSGNLKRVIDQVLNYSKLQAGGFSNDVKPFDLYQTLTSVMDLHTPFAQQQDNQLVLSGIDQPLFLGADESKLRQVLINLVGNALKFTVDGEVSVHSDLDENSKTLTIYVRDTGEGIPEVLQPKIFQSYWSFDSNRGGSKGTGLGLNICKQFIDIMGGDIRFESTPGQGTKFEIRLPVARVEANEEYRQVEAEQVPEYFSGQVLLAEDNRTNQYLIQLLLERRGLRVHLADSGVEAIAQIEANHYDLVLMDISMPVMDGLEATRKLRERYSKEQLPIVAMTAHAGDEDHARFLAAGMNSAMSKPIDLHVLNQTLARWCQIEQRPDQSENQQPGRQEVQQDEQRPSAQAESLEEESMETGLLDEQEAEKLHGELGVEVFRQINGVFQVEARERLDEIVTANQVRQGDDLAKKAHSIRSSAATLGCLPLAKRLKDIELLARDAESVETAQWTQLDEWVRDLPQLLTDSLILLADYSAGLE